MCCALSMPKSGGRQHSTASVTGHELCLLGGIFSGGKQAHADFGRDLSTIPVSWLKWTVPAAPRPSRPQVRPAQPVRQALIDDDDLGDVLTEESEGLLPTRSLSPRKRNLPSDQGGPQALPRLLVFWHSSHAQHGLFLLHVQRMLQRHQALSHA